MNRRRFLGAGAALAAGALATEGVVLQPRRLQVTHHRIGGGADAARAGSARAPTPGVATAPLASEASHRLAVLTDLHLDDMGAFQEEVARAVTEADVDMVVIVGDAIDDADRLPVLRDFLALLPSGATRYATLGNWEYWSRVDIGALRRTYERADTRLLVNEGVPVGPGATIFGADDSLAGTPDLSSLPDADGEVMLLAHCPAFRDELPPRSRRRIRTVISGHTHGGQITIAGWAPVRPAGSGPYVAGWYRGDGPDLFVSRGLGTSVVPIRLGAVPELAIVDWVPGGPTEET